MVRTSVQVETTSLLKIIVQLVPEQCNRQKSAFPEPLKTVCVVCVTGLLLNSANEISVAIQHGLWCGSVYAILTAVHKTTSQITVTQLSLTLCCGSSFLGCSVTCPEFPAAINMLLPELDCNQCSVIMPCMRETVIIHLIVFMCKLNKAKEYIFSPWSSGILKSWWALSWNSLLQIHSLYCMLKLCHLPHSFKESEMGVLWIPPNPETLFATLESHNL